MTLAGCNGKHTIAARMGRKTRRKRKNVLRKSHSPIHAMGETNSSVSYLQIIFFLNQKNLVFTTNLTTIYLFFRNTAPTGGVTNDQRNLDTATTEFHRRFHISVDDAESRHRNSVVNQVISLFFHYY